MKKINPILIFLIAIVVIFAARQKGFIGGVYIDPLTGYHLADGATSADLGLNGNPAINGAFPDITGWTSTEISQGDRPYYSNEKAYLGQLSIKFPETGGSGGNSLYLDIADSVFDGKVSFYLTSTHNQASFTYLGFYNYKNYYYYGWTNCDKVGSGNLCAIWQISTGDHQVHCMVFPTNWVKTEIDYSSPNTIKWFVNDNLCYELDVSSEYNSHNIEYLRFKGGAGLGAPALHHTYMDKFMVYKETICDTLQAELGTYISGWILGTKNRDELGVKIKEWVDCG